MKSVPNVPKRIDPPTVDWEKMRTAFHQQWFTGYLVYQDDNGKLTIVKEHIEKKHQQDKFKSFVKGKAIDLMLIIDHDSTEIIWADPSHPAKVGDVVVVEEVHQMWARLTNLPRYYDAGGGKVIDNYNGSKIVDRP